ncbi:MAG: hypothetical protein QM723_00695 [Myxococcaceae bacterium]
MPPDVFLVLASSGITLVASLLFLVSHESPPKDPFDDPRLWVSFCDPPMFMGRPPPLPKRQECSVSVSTPALHGLLTLAPAGDEWIVTLDTSPLEDSAAMQVRGTDGVGAVTDLRWHGRAGLARPVRRTWRQKPGQA